MPNNPSKKTAIKSTSLTELIVLWLFTLVFIALSVVLLVSKLPEVLSYNLDRMDKEQWMILGFSVYFPLMTLFMLVQTIRKTLKWQRYGKTPVTLDPNPASLGGDFGGYIDIAVTYKPSLAYIVKLQQVRTTYSGSGDSRSSSQSITWSCDVPSQTLSIGTKTRIQFLAELPADLADSDSSGYHWQMLITNREGTPEFDRLWTIPVKAGVHRSNIQLSSSVVENHEQQVERDAKLAAGYSQQGGQQIFHFKPKDHKTIAVPILAVGLIFGIIGTGLLLAQFELILALPFALAGCGAMLSGVYMLGRTRKVTVNRTQLVSELSFCGYVFSRVAVQLNQLDALETEAGSTIVANGKTIQSYKVIVRTSENATHSISLGLNSLESAEAVAKLISLKTDLNYRS